MLFSCGTRALQRSHSWPALDRFCSFQRTRGQQLCYPLRLPRSRPPSSPLLAPCLPPHPPPTTHHSPPTTPTHHHPAHLHRVQGSGPLLRHPVLVRHLALVLLGALAAHRDRPRLVLLRGAERWERASVYAMRGGAGTGLRMTTRAHTHPHMAAACTRWRRRKHTRQGPCLTCDPANTAAAPLPSPCAS